ncbi:MAG: PIN domain-containing protein [Candidatus Lokiarchaeota archaeon]|nr:PIN domain-containing protein [Candidatus Lokiarchaeota archaeon]MBD3338246.1 PIN domain-containing protein [Candidatus Lokiarchaeota archaeon]
MMVYLDVCCWNRPFDDQTQEKIHLETEAILIILSSDRWELVGSDIVDFEISKIPDIERKKKVELLAQKVLKKQKISADLIKRAKNIEQKGIKPLDALHIASAEFLQSDYMITTDADIVKKYQNNKDFFTKIKIFNPILFLTEVL